MNMRADGKEWVWVPREARGGLAQFRLLLGVRGEREGRDRAQRASPVKGSDGSTLHGQIGLDGRHIASPSRRVVVLCRSMRREVSGAGVDALIRGRRKLTFGEGARERPLRAHQLDSPSLYTYACPACPLSNECRDKTREPHTERCASTGVNMFRIGDRQW